ncbi:MAG: pyridoxal-phosphate dependent enzyme, partial [Halioglobus sp.]|nr:pyridoxal-phosphate dependent enzyme [Halioglobus sp.]
AVLSLPRATAGQGVATHSSGNHAAALALAAASAGRPAHVVMPESTPAVKVAAVRGYGAEVIFCAPTLAAREAALAELVERTGVIFIPPYDHPDIIAGQGTCALEIAEQCETAPDVLITPVGGGGLLAGCAVAARALLPGTEIVGAEPSGADDAARSLASGERLGQPAPDTIADGLRGALGQHNFEIIRQQVDAILTVPDSLIVEAMRLLWSRTKLVVEASAAVPLAVMLAHPERFAGRRVVMVLSGGNVDLDQLPW